MLFREHGIEIAFNQMDVYIKNMQGDEQKVESARRCRRRGTSPSRSCPFAQAPSRGLFFQPLWRL